MAGPDPQGGAGDCGEQPHQAGALGAPRPLPTPGLVEELLGELCFGGAFLVERTRTPSEGERRLCPLPLPLQAAAG